jgi:hypothetical protein
LQKPFQNGDLSALHAELKRLFSSVFGKWATACLALLSILQWESLSTLETGKRLVVFSHLERLI